MSTDSAAGSLRAAFPDPAGLPLCPSAQAELPGARIFGVVAGTVDEPRVAYLNQSLPATPELLQIAEPARPGEVFRIAATCVGTGCRHYDGTNCQLAKRTVELLPVVVEALPPCRVRPQCRWWLQEGKAACLRCPQVVTECYEATPRMARAAMGE